MAAHVALPLPPRWTTALPSPFVGREREVDVLTESWRAAAAGARRIVVIGGEAGVGKSRLIAEVALAHWDGEMTVLLGTCAPNFGAPYQPFAEPIAALLPLLDDRATGGGDENAIPGAERLVRTVAGAARLSDEELRAQSPRQLFQACTDVVAGVAQERPLALVLEDVHWAGETSLQLLRYLVHHSATSRLLLVITHRTEPGEQSPELAVAMAELHRADGARRIDLVGLAVDAIEDLLAREPHPTGSIARRAALLREQTGGNPFLLKEVTRDLSLQDIDALRHGDVRTPDFLRDSVRERLAELAPVHQQVVEIAAAIGDEFSVDLLIAVARSAAGSANASADAAATFAALDAAAARGLVDTGRDAVGRGRFPHTLARQAVLDLMGEFDRATVHAQVAHVLESAFPAAQLRVQRLAHHFASAHPLGDTGKAVRYLTEAAQIAEAGLAHDEAAHLYERAAALVGDPDARDELTLAAARSLLRAGKFIRARELDESVEARSIGRLQLRACVGYEAASWRSGEPGESAIRLLTNALADFEPDEQDPVYVRAIAALGRARAFTGDDEGSRSCDVRALRMARCTGDERLVAAVLQIGLQTVLTPDNVSEKFVRAVELTELCERIADMRHLGPAAYHRAATAYVQGNPVDLNHAHVDLLRATRFTGQPFWEWVASCVSFGEEFRRADFATATRTLAASSELARAFDGDTDTDGAASLQEFMLRRESGRLGLIGRLVSGDEDPSTRWAPGLLAVYCELDMESAARRVLDYILSRDLARHRTSSTWAAVLAFTCEAVVWLEDRVAARALYPIIVEHAGQNLMGGEFLALFGSADRLLGALASVLGDSAADRHFDVALEMDTRMGSPLHVATTLAAHAIHLQRTAAAAAEVLDPARRARAIADRYALARVSRCLAQVEDKAARRDKLPDRLTQREVDVLRLLGDGSSNRLIAERLVISENTAANHVRSILMKIGAANRTQAAMYAAAHGLLDARVVGTSADGQPDAG